MELGYTARLGRLSLFCPCHARKEAQSGPQIGLIDDVVSVENRSSGPPQRSLGGNPVEAILDALRYEVSDVPAGIDEDTLFREYRGHPGELTIAIDAVDMRGTGEPRGFRGSAFLRTGRSDVREGARCVTGTIGAIVAGGFDTSAYADCRDVPDGDVRACKKVGGVVAQEIFTHELAHALGWEHPNGSRSVGNDDTVMSSKCRSSAGKIGGCTEPTQADKLTGGLAYQMVPGNDKHDADPEPTHLLLPRCEPTNVLRSAVGPELRIFRDWGLRGRRR